ncbi:NAD(P)/FAD-dependent oxidoreductase [Nocardioides sp. AE5]|uniref:FAD-dependent oxidoreductase n=1 Tax=Nocardioides sp. AE5 TaxID=2962573 RepID=UPI0028826F6C|nr:NAD(P)/FAD-dependent oxidoreductase [Nocardioides sp. AE5]MDT0201841.1 NAD(P)/FAD-dependent oxidoreductase [Nocardioides sp. AE5]
MTPPVVGIVGAGPVGLTAALALTQLGVRVEIWDANDEPATEWRASTFHAPSLSIADELGVFPEMRRRGIVCPIYQIWDGATMRMIAEFDLATLRSATRHPYRLQLEQYKYVDILLAKLEEYKVFVNWGKRAVSLTQDDDGVSITFDSGELARADWLIGADGAHSIVRKTLKIAFSGVTYEHRYLVMSVQADLRKFVEGLCDVNYIADPNAHALLLRIPDAWRAVFAIPTAVADDEARASAQARLQALMSSRFKFRPEALRVYAVHQRVAEAMRVGRVLLVGDAAHINSPMGGMGLNSGIHDAFDVSVQLKRVVDGSAQLDELDDWAQRRHSAAIEGVQRITDTTTRWMGESDEVQRTAFADEMRRIAADPQRSFAWMREASMLESTERYGLPLVAFRQLRESSNVR